MVSTCVGDLDCVGEPPISQQGGEVLVVIRPESISLSRDRPDGANVIKARLQEKLDVGSYTEFFLDTGDSVLRSQSADMTRAEPGEEVYLSIQLESCCIIDP